jgi:hypothetical protein
MNDVVFVMTNSKLDKKRQGRKGKEFNLEDLDSDDDWLVEENSDFELDDLSSEIGASATPSGDGEDIGLASLDDLEIPNIEELALEDNGDGDLGLGEDHETEDEMHGDIDFYDENLHDLLDCAQRFYVSHYTIV